MTRGKVLVIAEAGVNHNGSEELAFKLVDAAAEAGADIVKFQTFSASALASPEAGKAAYQRKTTKSDEGQLAMLRKLELPLAVYPDLMQHCEEKGIRFLSTPFDFVSIDFLASIGLSLWKIPSGEITDLPYLRKIGSLQQRVILSTGMSTLDEVADALTVLEKAGTPRESISLLHCTTEYPAPFDSVNLKAMMTMRDAFPDVACVGYSDHTQGITIPIAAVAMRARIIEKHFTLDRAMEGPDHKASLEPDELIAMVSAIRNVEKAMGDGKKQPVDAEIPNMTVARKSLVAARAIRSGECFTEDNMTVKRPGNGISPMRWDEFIGRRASRDYAKDELLCEE